MSLSTRIDHAKAISTTVQVTRIRLAGEFRTLCDAVGFDAALCAVQAEIQRVAIERREAGKSNGGFIG